MSIFIKFPIGLSFLFLTSLSHIHADTLSDSWAVCQASEDSTSCDGECNQSNNIITIVESGNKPINIGVAKFYLPVLFNLLISKQA